MSMDLVALNRGLENIHSLTSYRPRKSDGGAKESEDDLCMVLLGLGARRRVVFSHQLVSKYVNAFYYGKPEEVIEWCQNIDLASETETSSGGGVGSGASPPGLLPLSFFKTLFDAGKGPLGPLSKKNKTLYFEKVQLQRRNTAAGDSYSLL